MAETTEVGVGKTTVDITTGVVVTVIENEVEDGVESVSGERVAVRETGCSVVTTSAVVDSGVDTL